MTVKATLTKGTARILRTIGLGFFHVTHNSFALLGLGVVFAIIAATARPELRDFAETHVVGWIQGNSVDAEDVPPEPSAVERATAADPQTLPKPQAAVVRWLSRKYNVAAEPLSALVVEAHETGQRTKLDPLLILAVMAVESGFNPFAQSHVGAQGLMQVMTKVHSDKYQGFGGKLAAFDPVANMRVGVKVLKECIARAGSVEGGLKYYVGAANMEDDGGYVAKVLAEQSRLQQVASGKSVPMFPAQVVTVPEAPKPTEVSEDSTPELLNS